MKPEVVDEPSQVSGDHRQAALRPGFELPESKLHPPAARPGIVARTALVDRLAAAQAPVIVVMSSASRRVRARARVGVVPGIACSSLTLTP